jgi:hypothetical protein
MLTLAQKPEREAPDAVTRFYRALTSSPTTKTEVKVFMGS